MSPPEFGQFNMNGQVSNDAKEISWKAVQTYKDGSLVEWVGAPGSDSPASVTKVNPKPAGTPAEGHEAAVAPTATEKTTNNMPLYTSIAALVVSLVSLVVSLRRKA